MTELLVNGKPIRYDLIPVSYMEGGLRRYLEKGIPPGSFMYALLCNDLMEATGRADAENTRALTAWAAWLYNYAPPAAYGSLKRVEAWMKSRSPK